ncbi:MAG: response regulator [Leptospiraceae bacterium]|nr:response regulator [Leptospiraceae bacterium]MCP5494373.1 response regulator [Leptospiraceae bacterium]
MKILIVDDNDRYANALTNFFKGRNLDIVRAVDAKEGFEIYQKMDFHTIITDITMETQVSGLFLARKIYKTGYKGNLIIATTGFDAPGVMFVSRFILAYYAGIGWMIPKKPLKRGEVLFYPTILKNGIDFLTSIKRE